MFPVEATEAPVGGGAGHLPLGDRCQIQVLRKGKEAGRGRGEGERGERGRGEGEEGEREEEEGERETRVVAVAARPRRPGGPMEALPTPHRPPGGYHCQRRPGVPVVVATSPSGVGKRLSGAPSALATTPQRPSPLLHGLYTVHP